jgi:hypothetical protein
VSLLGDLMDYSRHVILGLPASGKTTFLAALWHLIQADEADCRLVLQSYEGDVKYLNRIAEAWRTFQVVGRTSQIGDVDVSMIVKDPESETIAELRFPDLAGESFDTQVERRRVKPGYVEGFSDDAGVLLFIKVNKGRDLTIAELNERLPPELLAAEAQAADGPPAADAPRPTEWSVNLVSPQVRIVQILSDLLDPPFAVKPRRLAVMLSAWDVLGEPRPAPTEWLRQEMSLVDQFLSSNSDMFETRVYGVSAQGMDLEEDDIDAMPQIAASRRIIIDGPDVRPHDLTAPLIWLMTGA